MFRIILLLAVMGCTLFAQSEQVVLSGTVTGSDGKGLAGVKLTLKKLTSLSATSAEDGSFSISSETAVSELPKPDPSIQVVLRGGSVRFTTPVRDAAGSIAIYTGSGKRLSETRFAFSTENQMVTKLPDLSSGIYLLHITLNENEYFRSLVCMGDDLYLERVSDGLRGGRGLTLQKQSAAATVDTIIATKTGFTTQKTSIDSYNKANIQIVMTPEGAGGACTRESLQELVNGFIAALAAADPTEMSLADGAKYIENMKASSMDAGVWKNKLKVGFHRDFFDVDSCKIFTEVMDYESAEPHEVGAQLRVKDDKITEISALVSSVGDWALDKAADFKFRYTISSAEKWDIVPVTSRDDRETIQAAGDSYLDLFNDKSVTVPWGKPCARLEGNMYTGNKNNLDDPNTTCNSGVPSGVKINARTYVVDVAMGSVSIFCKFGGSMPDSHLFRVENGKLRYVHTISIN